MITVNSSRCKTGTVFRKRFCTGAGPKSWVPQSRLRILDFLILSPGFSAKQIHLFVPVPFLDFCASTSPESRIFQLSVPAWCWIPKIFSLRAGPGSLVHYSLVYFTVKNTFGSIFLKIFLFEILNSNLFIWKK